MPQTCNTNFQLSAEILPEAVFHDALVNSAVSIIQISSRKSPVLHDVKVMINRNFLSVQFPFVLKRKGSNCFAWKTKSRV